MSKLCMNWSNARIEPHLKRTRLNCVTMLRNTVPRYQPTYVHSVVRHLNRAADRPSADRFLLKIREAIVVTIHGAVIFVLKDVSKREKPGRDHAGKGRQKGQRLRPVLPLSRCIAWPVCLDHASFEPAPSKNHQPALAAQKNSSSNFKLLICSLFKSCPHNYMSLTQYTKEIFREHIQWPTSHSLTQVHPWSKENQCSKQKSTYQN